MNRLSIGAGPSRRPGWHTLDADPAVGADFVCAVPPLPDAVRAIPWDEVEMIHFLEHLYLWHAQELLREVYEVLSSGGKLIIEAPNIDFAARVLTGQQAPVPGTAPGQCDMWPLYGDPNHRNPLFGHRWGYTPQTLRAELRAAGFGNYGIRHAPAQSHVPARDFRLEASK